MVKLCDDPTPGDAPDTFLVGGTNYGEGPEWEPTATGRKLDEWYRRRGEGAVQELIHLGGNSTEGCTLDRRLLVVVITFCTNQSPRRSEHKRGNGRLEPFNRGGGRARQRDRAGELDADGKYLALAASDRRFRPVAGVCTPQIFAAVTYAHAMTI